MRYTISFPVTTLLMATAAFAEVPRVVTDIAPVHSLVSMVMGDIGAPGLLVKGGADPHSFQLRPSQAADLQKANLIVWMGAEMSPWLRRSLDGLETTAVQIALLSADVTETRSYTDAGADGHDHAAAEPTPPTPANADMAGTEASATEASGHDGIDPHAWLDPHNAAAWLGLIAAELSALDPEHAAIYAGNAARGAADITALEGELTALLAPVKSRPFVVYHDAYGYFSGHFGLTVAGEVAIGDASSPSAARLADLRATLTAGSPVCIFPEAGHNPKLLLQIADGLPVAIGGVLDPEGAALAPGPALYPALMRGLATTLADCLTSR